TIERAALPEDDRHARERDDVVDDGRLTEQSFDGGQRRTRTNLAAFALEALEHRGLFSADVGASPQADVQIEGVAAVQNVAAQVAAVVRRRDRGAERAVGVRVLSAEIDEPRGR